jgi:hypothetical protein
MKFAALALVVVVSSAPAFAQKPYEFRGIPLGMTLGEFRAAGHVRAIPLGSVPICETDAEAVALGMQLRGASSASIACKWAHRTEAGWRASQAVVDGAPSRDHILRFAAMPGDDEPRLYRMSFVIDAALAADFTDALSSRFGKCRTKREHGYTRLVWENDTSSITLEANGAAATARVIYRLKDHEAWIAHLADQWRVADAAPDTP